MGAAMMVAKAILGGIGGGLQGAGKGSRTVDANDMNTNHSQEFSDSGYQVGNMGLDKVKEKIFSKFSTSMDKDNAETTTDTSTGADVAEASNASDAASALSDVLLKTVYGEELDDKIIDNFAKISAISFEYNDEAKEEYGEEKAVDENQHIGVIAQELAENPVTEGAVKSNENGDLEVDTRHLTFADTAAIAELSRRVLALEEAVKEIQQNN
jgi:hypothetical protein